MLETTITVNNKTFVLKFGMKVLRLLSEKWNAPGLIGVLQKLSVFEGMTDDITFEQLDVMNDLILAAVSANDDNSETLTSDELDQLFLNDNDAIIKIIEEVLKGFIASIPRPKSLGKQKAAKK
jgi:hypothetical protein